MITPVLDGSKSESIYIQLYKYLVQEITALRLKEHGKVPSVRKLAAHLDVSRTTVENAYNQLLDEGYIYSLPKKGYYISPIGYGGAGDRHVGAGDGYVGAGDRGAGAGEEEIAFDFKSEYIEPGCFDAKVWKKHVNAIFNYEEDVLHTFAAQTGEERLKEAIVQYYYRTRNVKATPDRILVGAGIQTLLEQLAKYFRKEEGSAILVENPGFNLAKRIFSQNGFRIENLDVDEKGVLEECLDHSTASLCYISPSHQYPTGNILSVKDRYKLLEWATKRNGYIIEDDYNSHLRYTGRPIPSMQGLDGHDRVIYAGSFSTILTPAIRISFLVLPESLSADVKTIAYHVQTASKIEQLALARMIEGGDFARHLKKIRAHYARKYTTFTDIIKRELDGHGRLKEGFAGLYVLFYLNEAYDAKKVVEDCLDKGVLVDWLGNYYLERSSEHENALILGFRGMPVDLMKEGLEAIKDVIASITCL